MRLPNGYGGVIKLAGNRRRPYAARVTTGWHQQEKTGKKVQEYRILGYSATHAEALQMLATYHTTCNQAPSSLTFSEVYSRWSLEKFPTVSHSNINGYKAAYRACQILHEQNFASLRLTDLQSVIDTCKKNYPSLQKINILFHQLYDYGLRHEYISKNYAQYVNIQKYKNRNPNKINRDRFYPNEVNSIWAHQQEPYYQIILMLIYSGVRVSELLNLRKENVHLKEQYFDVLESKTENGIRKVPIADKVLPFYQNWYRSAPECPFLLHTPRNQHFTYRNYYEIYFKPYVKALNIAKTPHCCRHTCISLLAENQVSQTIIKKIVGHSGAMSLTEKVYTHFDIQELIDAINTIP